MTLEDFFSVFVRSTRLHVSYEIQRQPEDVGVNFWGEDAPILLARNAEVVRALEYLANHLFEKQEGRKIQVDCQGYRAIRAEELRLMALTAAEKVKRLGKPFPLSPMSPDERRIIHLALADEIDLRTESEGFGENRKVVIYPK
ncbi:MAG TPA: R3H domain-containing nucleic acid-binding protein [Terriglobia bacterium]|nr:R3H domain-containing nucleic acid-binding protein [Terriglobia bacterium]